MKKVLAFVLSVCVVMCLSGCGDNSQTEYDALQSELADLKNQIEQYQSQNDTTNEPISSNDTVSATTHNSNTTNAPKSNYSKVENTVPNSSTVPESSAENITEPENKLEENKEYTFGDEFEFDGFKLKIGSSYGFDVVENRFSDNNGKTVIKVPVILTNISDKTDRFSFLSYDVFGSLGLELDGVCSYFDESIDEAGDMRPGSTKETNFIFLYDGNGDYFIEFDNYRETITLKLPITK